MKAQKDALTGLEFNRYDKLDTRVYGDESPEDVHQYSARVCTAHAGDSRMRKALTRDVAVGDCGVVGCKEEAVHLYDFSVEKAVRAPRAPKVEELPKMGAGPVEETPTPTTVFPPVSPSPSPSIAPTITPAIQEADFQSEEEPETPAIDGPEAERTPEELGELPADDLYQGDETPAPGTPSTAFQPLSWKPKRKRPRAQKDAARAVAGMTE